jgi:hypothetical protein
VGAGRGAWAGLTLLAALSLAARADPTPAGPVFDVSFPESAHQGEITGRTLLMISRTNQPEVRLQVKLVTAPALFGLNVSEVKPGQSMIFDGESAGYLYRHLRDVPPGDYYVQALLNVYTRFPRADGHVIWAHMDQWEGQHFNVSPGNLYSKVERVRLGPGQGGAFKLNLTEVIPPIEVPADTAWVKHVKIRSELLSRFWGRPMYLGAVVLLPDGYDSHPDAHYPVVYEQGHFGFDAPFGFRTDPPAAAVQAKMKATFNLQSGYDFYRAWNGPHFPRMIAATFLHPTPYYDDSYAVNSANNGPYGDAIMTELIPYLETHFRIIRSSFARVLTGGSTGGWESLALQLYHPDFFGGAWIYYPDSIDFRHYELIDIYADENAFATMPKDYLAAFFSFGQGPLPERYIMRNNDGQPLVTVRQVSQLVAALGDKGRGGSFVGNWNAVYGPVGEDGYPQPLWDAQTGQIDRTVADYMRDHGYDLRFYAEKNWPRIGSKLAGKLHFYCGDMDNFYLNLAVYDMEAFLEHASPPYGGSFEFFRPLRGHGWRPMDNSKLVELMADWVARKAPPGSDLAWRGH